MIFFACPRCQKSFEVDESRQGETFPCAVCGHSLQVPAALQLPAGFSGPITVRLRGQGIAPRKFETSRTEKRVRQEIEDFLDALGLECSRSGEVFGQLRHGYSFVSAIVVDGELRFREDRGEMTIDLGWRASMNALAIVLAIFTFPIGLVLVILGHQMAQQEAPRLIKDAFRDLKEVLEE